MAFNFGYEFRQGWWRNYVFVAFALFYTYMQFYITMVPGQISCIWRVNCVNENTLRSITSADPMPIQNPFNTTIMPQDFRWKILLLMIGNAVATSMYEYFVVNGVRRRYSQASKQSRIAANGSSSNNTDDRCLATSVHEELAHEPKFALLHEVAENTV
jgi:hypothetical protein